MDATLELEFVRDGGATSFYCLQQEPPWKVVRGFSLKTGASLVHLNNVSGGILGGDALRISARLAPSAEAQITTTGATRVYRPSPQSADASLLADFFLDRDALLEYLPDAMIPFRQARVLQRTTYALAEGATLFAWDTLAPGRTASGEIFEYERVKLVSEITVGGKPMLNDRLLLEPRRWPLQTPSTFASCRYLVTMIVMRAGSTDAELRALEETLQELLNAATNESESKTFWGVSTLPAHGVMVRGLTNEPASIPGLLFRLWSAAKQQLCGREAVAPRKTY